jgi:hypothetical protein
MSRGLILTIMSFSRRPPAAIRPARRLISLLAVAAVLSGCVSGGSGGPEPAAHQPTELGRGTVAGIPWVLTVSSRHEGNLCMTVSDRPGSTAGPGDGVFAETGCGFGPPDERFAAPVDEAKAGDTRLLWGPAPDGAVRVRIDTFSLQAQTPTDPREASLPGCPASDPAHLWVDITDRLPAWTQPGGWFITHASGAGCGYSDAVFYDAQGRVVPEHRW